MFRSTDVMKIVVAIDKFKGSATSRQLCDAIEEVINQNCAGIEVLKVPLADGGDGTMQAIKQLLGDRCKECYVLVPGCLECLPPVEAHYLLDDKSATAYMDLATASGLALVPDGERDVMNASTIGTGVMIAHAIENGAQSIVLGLGGSATCDGAMGILAALGCEFQDAYGNVLRSCGGNLSLIDHIDSQRLSQSVRDVHFTLLTDVDNPLLGDNGAAAVYAPQKGASPRQVIELESGLRNLSRKLPKNVASMPGAGAAGGVAAGMVAMLDAVISPGVDFVLELSDIDNLIADAQLIITGEGRIDEQTMMGKAPAGVLRAARRHMVPAIALCGSLDRDADVDDMGFVEVIEVTPKNMPLQEAMNTSTTLSLVKKSVLSLLTRIL